MAFSILNLLFILVLSPAATMVVTTALPVKNSNSLDTHLSNLRNFCNNKPYPNACFNSLKAHPIDINIDSNLITFLLHSLEAAISEIEKLTNLFLNIGGGSNDIIEKQKGTIQDCQELHQITLSSLKRISVSRIQAGDPRKLSDARTYLSASLTNKNTCLQGLDSASGPLKSVLVNSLTDTYMHVSNSLSMLPKQASKKGPKNQRRGLLGFPKWVSKKDRRILESDGDDGDDEYDPSHVLTVAADGSGNFSSVSDAIKFAPSNSETRILIYVKKGVYKENVEITQDKRNIVLIGDGSDVTFITGSRSVDDGWTSFRSATLAVSGDGFLARDITIENTAGPQKHQAVALRINADLAAIYRCKINGCQDTLYVHSFRQFYRECDISGTIDYIFGNAATIIQRCNIISKMPMAGQFNVITAQSRETSDQNTGISIQNCSIVATDDLSSASTRVRSYLGRPWMEYSRTVILDSFIGGFIDPAGWIKWTGDENENLENLYYGEYDNKGAGSGIDNRVTWEGYHVMDDYDAYDFTVSNFIAGDQWLDSTSFPYDDQI
ncbi:probable pectinesterase/pectinesterase inhibitor 12 [Mercurialis annua]|uniref:probable pectinesterase/pectinesterase inhibitor 12 n=1 Tax=Mercurialis annua TaxID=3986 RepID=UPI00215FBE24|nr:probable pectinesterase/pectinesterase inhibitor 12 [Mercurialis annua]